MMKKVILVSIIALFSVLIFAGTLSQKDLAGIVYLREFEKMERDLFGQLYEKWDVKPMQNFYFSAENHMQSTPDELLIPYSIEDPIINDHAGVYTNSEIETLYKHFLENGLKSSVDGILTALTLKELSLYHSSQILQQTQNEDVEEVFLNRVKSSYNHFLALSRQLSKYNTEYQLQYLTQEAFNQMVDSIPENSHDHEGEEQKEKESTCDEDCDC